MKAPFTSIVKTIWITDDDPDDLEIFSDALSEIYPSAHLTTLSSGEELLKQLSLLPAPDLLFLDINMPCNGHDCLKTIRSQHKFQCLPIIIYSSSFRELDVADSYQLGANLYLKKPISYRSLLAALKQILQLDWTQPQDITSRQFVGNKYVPFTAL